MNIAIALAALTALATTAGSVLAIRSRERLRRQTSCASGLLRLVAWQSVGLARFPLTRHW